MRHYREILDKTRKIHQIVPFCQLSFRKKKKYQVLLRHDIDNSLHNALEMARCEKELGVKATYFVQLHCDDYPAGSAEGVRIIRELRDLGHEIGLHYDPSYYTAIEKSFGDGIKSDLRDLSEIAGRPVVSVSPHLPLLHGQEERMPGSVKYRAMDPVFVNGEYKYLSDSNGVFREGCFCTHLANRRNYCFLVHPVWWTTEGSRWQEKMVSQAELGCLVVRGRYRAKIDLYESIMKKRNEYDKRFAEMLKGRK